MFAWLKLAGEQLEETISLVFLPHKFDPRDLMPEADRTALLVHCLEISLGLFLALSAYVQGFPEIILVLSYLTGWLSGQSVQESEINRALRYKLFGLYTSFGAFFVSILLTIIKWLS